jgi:GTP-binding protein
MWQVMVENIGYSNAKYLVSAKEAKGLPDDEGAEVAFIGRSNAGKSSALNTITGIKGLARTSSTPGRTQMMNFFDLGHNRRLVDLPGYGYAKVPKPIKEKWQRATNEYLETRHCLRGLILVMDIRHPLKEQDWNILTWTEECDLPCHVLLTKADKLSRNKIYQVKQQVLAQVAECSKVTVEVFSSQNKQGLAEVQAMLDQWFRLTE